MKGNSVTRNAVYNIAYTVIGLAFSLISSIYISRVFAPAGVGQIAYMNNIVSYFVSFAPLGIPTYGIRAIADSNNKQTLNNTYSELFILNFISTVFFSVIYIVLVFVNPNFYKEMTLYLIAGIPLFLNIFNNDWFYRGIEKYKYITIRSTLIKILSLVAIFVFVRDKSDILKYLLISGFATAGNYCWNYIHARKYVKLNFRFNSAHLTKHLKPIIALFISLVAGSIYSKIDITMLGVMCTDESVGYYSNAIKIVHMVTPAIAAITAVMLPSLSTFFSENKKREFDDLVTTTFYVVLLLAVPAFLGVLFIGEDIVVLLYGEAFLKTSQVLKVLSLLFIVVGVGDLLAYQLVVAVKKEIILPKIRIIATLLNAVLNFFLIMQLQETGAALATVITEVFTLIVVAYIMRKYISIKFNFKLLLSIIISSVIMCCALFIIGQFIESLIFRVVLSLVVAVVTYIVPVIFINKEVINEIIKKSH